jgi:hypothetical protein
MFRLVRRFRKIAKRDCQVCHVRLSVRVEQLYSHYTNFVETWYLSFSRKSVKKIQVSLKSDKNNGYFTWRRFHIYDDV